MRTMLLCAALLLATPAYADPAVEAPINAMVAAFNKGDVAAAKATHTADAIIVDEVAAPFAWAGPSAFDDWIGTLARTEQAKRRTGGVVAVGRPTRETVDGDTAYVVVPSTYSFQQGGRRMRETGTMTFVLAKGTAGWLIRSWTWSSPEAAAVR